MLSDLHLHVDRRGDCEGDEDVDLRRGDRGDGAGCAVEQNFRSADGERDSVVYGGVDLEAGAPKLEPKMEMSSPGATAPPA